MPWSDRLAVAALAAAVTVPPFALELFVRVLVGMGGGFTPWIVRAAFLLLEFLWTYEIVSRITHARVDRHRFSVVAVAIGTIAGLEAGMLTMITGSLLEPPVLGLVGAVVGTYLPAKRLQPPRSSRSSGS